MIQNGAAVVTKLMKRAKLALTVNSCLARLIMLYKSNSSRSIKRRILTSVRNVMY